MTADELKTRIRNLRELGYKVEDCGMTPGIPRYVIINPNNGTHVLLPISLGYQPAVDRAEKELNEAGFP